MNQDKKNKKTNPAYGSTPENRSIDEYLENSVICIDKPKGLTSHQIGRKINEILQVSKLGHSGQLEASMTGLVVILLGKSCKVTSFITHSTREYSLQIHFNKPITREILEDVLEKFTGKIKQVPLLRSRVRRVLRTRTVHEIKILEWKNKMVKIYVRCESGTYLRKLFYDMGRLLRSNVNLSHIRRLGIGNLKVENAVTFENLEKACADLKNGNEKSLRKCLVPIELSVTAKSITVKDEAVFRLCCGNSLYISQVCEADPEIEADEKILLKSLKNEIVCVAKAVQSSEEIQKGEEGIVALPSRIVMSPSLYSLHKNSH